ncbi:MAG: hypothetical protein ABIP51_02230 [Bacteroidia bacterium]
MKAVLNYFMYPFLYIVLTSIIFLSGCKRMTDSENQKKCNCDSSFVENENKYSCYFGDKKIYVLKNKKENTIELKKFYRKNDSLYQKCEYLLLINDSIDFGNSLFIDFMKIGNKIEFKSHSIRNPSRLDFVTENDTMSFKGNTALLSIENIKSLKKINQVFIENDINNSEEEVMQILSYPYSYNDILNNRTLYNQYLELKKCGLIR